MSKTGVPHPVRVTPSNKAAVKKAVIEYTAAGDTLKIAAEKAGTARRTINEWKQKDEKFAVAMAAAQNDRRDFWVDKCQEYALDENNPYRHLMLMFITKQVDPSFRDNHKVEHVVSGGLAASLKQLAKLGRSE